MWGGGEVPVSHVDYIRNGNVALSDLRKPRVALLNLRKHRVALSNLRKCHAILSLRPKNGCFAVSISGVYTHTTGLGSLWQPPL